MKILRQKEQWPFRTTAAIPEPQWRNDQVNPRGSVIHGRPPWHETGEGIDVPSVEPELPLKWKKSPIKFAPIQLWRGVNVRLSDLPEETKERLTGEGGLFSTSPSPVGGQFGAHLLDQLKSVSSSYGQGHQLGTHWTVDPNVARKVLTTRPDSYTDHDWSVIPMMVGATWDGRGEDPDHWDRGFPKEKEITMLRGAPLTVNQLLIQHPVTGDWHDVTPSFEKQVWA